MTIDVEFMDRVGMYPYEKVLVGNLSNGNRFETYAIPGERGRGEIILNGATSHLGKSSDLLTIMSYTLVEESLAKKWQPKVIVLGEKNAVIHERGL